MGAVEPVELAVPLISMFAQVAFVICNVAPNSPPSVNLLQPKIFPCAVTVWFAGVFPRPGEMCISSLKCRSEARLARSGRAAGYFRESDDERERHGQRYE